MKNFKINTGKDCNGNIAVTWDKEEGNALRYIPQEIADYIAELQDKLTNTENLAISLKVQLEEAKDKLHRRNLLTNDLRKEIISQKERVDYLEKQLEEFKKVESAYIDALEAQGINPFSKTFRETWFKKV